MAYINGKKLLQVVKVVDGGGSGGGAALNLAYGLTPPSDTTKIWVRTENEPSNILVDKNMNIAIATNEHAGTKTNSVIQSTYYNTSGNMDGLMKSMLKINGVYYIATPKLNTNNSSYFDGYAFNCQSIIKKENDTISVWKEHASGAGSGHGFHFIVKVDNDNIITGEASGTSSSTSYSYVKLINITNGTETILRSGFTAFAIKSCGACYDGNALYTRSAVGTSGSNQNWTIQKLTLSGVLSSYQFTLTGITSSGGAKDFGFVPYGDYLYFTIVDGSTNKTQLWRWKKDTTQVECVVADLNIGIVQYSAVGIYQNKMILTNATESLSDTTDYIHIIDLNTFVVNSYNVGTYRQAYMCIDEASGNIELWGGLPSNTSGLRKILLSNLYNLQENKLELFFDNYSMQEIDIVKNDTITVKAPINHAWLGDSNSIAQPIDMFYYKNNLWWGINCLGYTQLKSAIIIANAVSIDLANTTTDTQTISVVSVVWAYQIGQYTISATSSDETIATASLSGDSLTIIGVSVGSATITILVVDEYGTTFTRTITATITNSGA